MRARTLRRRSVKRSDASPTSRDLYLRIALQRHPSRCSICDVTQGYGKRSFSHSPVEPSGHRRSRAAGRRGAAGDCATRGRSGGTGRAAALFGRRLFIALHLLHVGAPSLGTRGIQPHRGRARGTPVPVHSRSSRFSGDVTVTTVGLVAKVLTEENHRDVLSRAAHRSKREVEELVASLRPRPDAPSIIRKLPALAVEEKDGSPSSPGPVSPESSPAGDISAASYSASGCRALRDRPSCARAFQGAVHSRSRHL